MKKLQIVVGSVAILVFVIVLAMTASIAQAGHSSSDTPAELTATAVANIALYKSVTTNATSCVATEGPEKAVDGIWANRSISNEWCATTPSTKWITVDLGQKYYVTSITIAHAYWAGDDAIYNTRDFSVRRSIDGFKWATLLSVVGNTSNSTWIPLSPSVTARYIRVTITQGTQPGKPNYARLNEIIVQGSPAP